jgi:CO/xanthine dehydrogenase Mo-binding subunit
MSDIKYIGQRLPRYEGEGRVTGKTVYVDDVQVAGMKYVKVFRSPVHHGLIKSLDTSGALSVPGVTGVVTAKDVPGVNDGYFGDLILFAEKEVRFKGQVIAAVVGDTEDIAQEGVNKIKAEFEELPAVFTIDEAKKPGAVLARYGTKDNYFYWGDSNTFRIKLGDVEEGFKQADFIVESDYTEGGQDHACMEPHVSVAYFDGADRLCIHTVSQCLYFQLRPLCGILNLPMSKIRYIGGNVGGGFGSKNEIHADHIAGVCAIKFRQPVKFRWTREENLLYATKRGAWHFHYKDGVTKDGRIVARHVQHYKDAGAFTTFSPYGVEKGSMFLNGPYYIPNILIEGHAVYTNKPTSSAMRGFTILNGQFCTDVQLQKIADKLGMDPWELRMKNAFRDGDLGASRYVVAGAGAIEAAKANAALAGVALPESVQALSSRGR